MSRDAVKNSLLATLPSALVEQLFETYDEVERNFYLGHLRPNEVEGGRFAEVVLRMLEHHTTGKHTPLGRQLKTEVVIKALEQLPSATFPDSVRVHIPRTLRVVYDIRNKRDAAHLGDLQDATLVCGGCDWVMAELVRLFHKVSPNEAQKIVEGLVVRRVPAVQEFGRALKTLRPGLSAGERVLVLLYHRGAKGASAEQLREWVKPSQRAGLPQTLYRLQHDRDLIHRQEDRAYRITRAGEAEVEAQRLIDPS